MASKSEEALKAAGYEIVEEEMGELIENEHDEKFEENFMAPEEI